MLTYKSGFFFRFLSVLFGFQGVYKKYLDRFRLIHIKYLGGAKPIVIDLFWSRDAFKNGMLQHAQIFLYTITMSTTEGFKVVKINNCVESYQYISGFHDNMYLNLPEY